MKVNANKLLKFLVPVASVVVSIATGYINKKDQDELITKKVAEEFAKFKGEEA